MPLGSVGGGVSNIVLDGIISAYNFPPWVTWTDAKSASGGPPAVGLQGSGVQANQDIDKITIRNSTFRHEFDGIAAPQIPTNLRIHDNLFDGVRDDTLQLGTAGYDVEFDHNMIVNASKGPAWNGSGRRSRLFAKTYRNNRGAGIFEKLTRFSLSGAGANGVLVPKPVAYLPEIHMLVTEFVDGNPLAAVPQ